MSGDRGHLATEAVDARTAELDRSTTEEALALFARADREAARAVEVAGPELARAVDLVAERLRSGGRLIYLGAGTSGRLGALDASECPPTFGSDPETVRFLIAGGHEALTRPVEGAEDDREAGAAGLQELELESRDAVVGVTAGGTTPFVHGALAEANSLGAATVMIACVPEDQAPAEVDVDVRLLTGPEVLAGSTRLKAGTATKMALNALSTLVMVRLGKTYGNLMVDVDSRANVKLVDRAERIVMAITGATRERAQECLEGAGGNAKLAVLLERGMSVDQARARLDAAEGHLRSALED